MIDRLESPTARGRTWLWVAMGLSCTQCFGSSARESDEHGDGIGGIHDELGEDPSSGDAESSDDLPDLRLDLGPIADWAEGGGDGVGDESVTENAVCNIDFLFVIDNSRSMRNEQTNLSASVPEFIETLTTKLPEVERYHVGVTATEPYAPNAPGCTELGGLIVSTGGNDSSNAECGPYADGGGYMTNDDDLDRSFACAARPGTQGSTNERPIRALLEAVGGAPSQAGGCNEGFLRDDALLVVTLITDEEDDDQSTWDPNSPNTGSGGEPAQWYEDLVAAKGGDPDRIVVLGLVGTPTDNECDPLTHPGDSTGGGGAGNGAEVSQRLIDFVNMFGERGTVGDVCATSYGRFFDEAISVIEFACDNIPPAR